jgi:hypothetical protein
MEVPVRRQEPRALITDAGPSSELEMFTMIRNSEVGKNMTSAEIREIMVDICLRKA